jgi:Transposase DDE domain group 1
MPILCRQRGSSSDPRPGLQYNLGNFMRTLAMPKTAEPWSLTSSRERLIKIGAEVVSHGRYVTFQMAEVAVPRQMFKEILMLIARLPATARSSMRGAGIGREQRTTAEVRLDEGKATGSRAARRATRRFGCQWSWLRSNFVAATPR